MFYIKFNNINSKDIGLEVIKKPFIPIPQQKFLSFELDGTDGTQYEKYDLYNDIEIPIEFNFLNNDIRKTKKKIMNWLKANNNNILILSNYKNYFYKVKNITTSNIEYDNMYDIQRITITFTCYPFEYLVDGQEEIKLNDNIENHYLVSKPTYKIVGDGICSLIVNNQAFQFKIDEYLYINCELGLIYKEIGNYIFENAIKFDVFDSLYLLEGSNTFSWSNGFEIYITPNYRE